VTAGSCQREGHRYAAELDDTGALFLGGSDMDPHPDGVFEAVCARRGCQMHRYHTWSAGVLIHETLRDDPAALKPMLGEPFHA